MSDAYDHLASKSIEEWKTLIRKHYPQMPNVYVQKFGRASYDFFKYCRESDKRLNKHLFKNGFPTNELLAERSIITNFKLPNAIFNGNDWMNGNYGWLDDTQTTPPFVALGGFIKLCCMI